MRVSSLTENRWLYLIVAAGLFLFGVHGFVEARWRRGRDEECGGAPQVCRAIGKCALRC